MKKLMFMLAAVAMAACSQAASVYWTCTNVKDSTGTGVSDSILRTNVNGMVIREKEIMKEP